MRSGEGGEGEAQDTLIIDPAFANIWDNILAQDASSSTLPSPPPEDKIINKTTTSFTFLPEFSGTKKKQKTQKVEVTHIITGYQAPSDCNFIQDILIYDIPVK
ncbi:hypothetical protein RclHR1_00240040 [Rhizophagus clarus]|uniref:Uncharacterized protein n=1 Tax=Rhizophagus clarus TaxID=94130 RepID=A0A2Z6R1K0_9GLOM|nr:hypothetical protein RclHR1_00240040 [Rhizophagus clarus]